MAYRTPYQPQVPIRANPYIAADPQLAQQAYDHATTNSIRGNPWVDAQPDLRGQAETDYAPFMGATSATPYDQRPGSSYNSPTTQEYVNSMAAQIPTGAPYQTPNVYLPGGGTMTYQQALNAMAMGGSPIQALGGLLGGQNPQFSGYTGANAPNSGLLGATPINTGMVSGYGGGNVPAPPTTGGNLPSANGRGGQGRDARARRNMADARQSRLPNLPGIPGVSGATGNYYTDRNLPANQMHPADYSQRTQNPVFPTVALYKAAAGNTTPAVTSRAPSAETSLIRSFMNDPDFIYGGVDAMNANFNTLRSRGYDPDTAYMVAQGIQSGISAYNRTHSQFPNSTAYQMYAPSKVST